MGVVFNSVIIPLEILGYHPLGYFESLGKDGTPISVLSSESNLLYNKDWEITEALVPILLP